MRNNNIVDKIKVSPMSLKLGQIWTPDTLSKVLIHKSARTERERERERDREKERQRDREREGEREKEREREREREKEDFFSVFLFVFFWPVVEEGSEGNEWAISPKLQK
jgi:hypothetical protein